MKIQNQLAKQKVKCPPFLMTLQKKQTLNPKNGNQFSRIKCKENHETSEFSTKSGSRSPSFQKWINLCQPLSKLSMGSSSQEQEPLVSEFSAFEENHVPMGMRSLKNLSQCFTQKENSVQVRSHIKSFKFTSGFQTDRSSKEMARIYSSKHKQKKVFLIPKSLSPRHGPKTYIQYNSRVQVQNNHIYYTRKIKSYVYKVKEPSTPTKQAPRTPSFQLNDYIFIKKLGKGAYSEVHLAQHKTTGFLFAIKIIKRQKNNDKNLEMIKRQIQNNILLGKEPNVVNLYGCMIDEENVYLLTEYMPLGNLFELWGQSKKISEKLAQMILKDICYGLKALHSRNIIHRDLKLQNILLSYNVAKIADLGCSVCSRKPRKSCLGSLQYWSPEQIKNQKYDSKVDMWSLGVIAFELLFGYSPFKDEVNKILRQETVFDYGRAVEFPERCLISKEGQDFIRRLLEQNPQRRISIEQALQHRFLSMNG